MGSGASQPVSAPSYGRQLPAVIGSYQAGYGQPSYPWQQQQQHTHPSASSNIRESQQPAPYVMPSGQPATYVMQSAQYAPYASPSLQNRPLNNEDPARVNTRLPSREASPPPPLVPHTHQNAYPHSIGFEEDNLSNNDLQNSLQNSLLNSYGEQDYDLREMTWPLPNNVLLTEQDVRDGDNFVAEMEEKRILYEHTQADLLRKLQVDGATNTDDTVQTCDLITNLCQLHHLLYGGHDDELGIDFAPAMDSSEDNYILEQLDSLSRRHHQELVKSDGLCAVKLLERRGPGMTAQTLDSILEEHIKLRSYMRTRQTKDQIAAYSQVQSSIRENPSLYRSSQQRVGQAGKAILITSTADHPIVRRLPVLSQVKIKSIGATRGQTVIVDAKGAISSDPSQPHSSVVPNVIAKSSTAAERQSETNNMYPSSDSESDEETIVAQKRNDLSINSGSIWARVPSVDEEEVDSRPSQPTQSAAQAMPSTHSGLTVVTADPRYIAAVDFGVSRPSSVRGAEGDSLLRTGVLTGTVSTRVSQYTTASNHLPEFTSSADRVEAQRREERSGRVIVDEYEDDFDEEDDDDLLAQYKRTLKAGGGYSEDDDSVNSSKQITDQESSESESEHNSNGGDEKLLASAKLKDELSDALWDNQREINLQNFHALISMWQDKQQSIALKGGEEAETDSPSNAKALWQKVKEKMVNDAIKEAGTQADSDSASEDESPINLGKRSQSSSTGMQTSLTRNQSASVQTEAAARGVDAAVLVDEFLIDDKDKRKIKKLDKKLIEQLAKGELSEEEFRKLLARNRDNVDKLRKQREANRLKSLQLLKERRSKQNQDSDVELDSDDEVVNKIEQIEEKVMNKLLKHRHDISEQDMKSLLKEARKQQDDILRQRKIERLRQNERMREKLLEKRNAKMQEKKETSGSKLTDLEAKFYDELKGQLASGDLSHDQFKVLIEQHLSKIGSTSSLSKPTDKASTRQKDEADSKEEQAMRAQSIIRKGHEKNKAILNVRQRERQNAVAELKQKRKNKREKTFAS